jgi:L-ribulose-5-phosphate 3-epimerase
MNVKAFRWFFVVALLFVGVASAEAQQDNRYRVSVCDWMMLKRQKLGEFALARTVGADGVEVDMGPLGKRVLFENKLRDPAQAARFRHVADSLGLEISSMAMSGFFAQSFLQRDNYEDLIADCLSTMKLMGTRVAFLPLGGSGQEWPTDPKLYAQMVERLHRVGEMAKAQGCVIGIRTAKDAKFDKKLLKKVDSEGIKIYYNLQDALDQQRDVCKDLKKLGAKNIIQIHASNTDGKNLRDDPEVNMPAIKATLDKMGWKGWLVVERSRDASKVRNVKYNFTNNVTYLHEIFGKASK